MNIKIFSLLSLLIVSFNIYSQEWPILQLDDPNHYYIISCTMGEIHGTHFHEAIDIDCYEFVDEDGVEVRSIENGYVVYPGTYSILIGHNPTGNTYERFSRYLHMTLNDNLIVGTEVIQGVTVLGNVDGATIGGYVNNHLHLEMGEYVGNNTLIDGNDILLHPINNNSGWQVALPSGHDDTYPPQINDIIIEPLNDQSNNIPSGFNVYDPNNNNGAIIFHTDYLKAHIANTTYSNYSTGSIYNFTNEKIIIWGNIGFIVNARDVGVNSLPGGANTSSGEGLTVKSIQYSYIDDEGIEHDKYVADFSEMLHGERNSINQFFHQPYFDTHYEYGNNDFIELRSTDDTYLHIHQQINGIQSNGIWFTKALNTTDHVFNQTPTEVADVNDVALYKDGEQTLNFYVSDASGQCEDYDLKVVVDNFPPYVKKVEIYQGDIVNNVLIYSADWEWIGLNNLLDFHPNIPQVYPGVISGDENIDHYISVLYSEPMSEALFSIPNMNINNEQPVAGTDNNKIYLLDGSRIIIADEGDYEIVFSGKDLANTDLFGFTSEVSLSGPEIPKRDINGNWAPGYTSFLDNIHSFTIENEECSADFYAENTNIPIGGSTVFHNTSVNCDMNENWNYKWVLDGGDPDYYNCGLGNPCLSTPTIQYNIPGVWQVRLLLLEGDVFIEVETKQNYITVIDNGSLPITDFSTDNGLTIFETESLINFVDLTTNNPVTWLWTFDGGFPNISFEQNPQNIEYPTTGTYDVSLKATNEFGSNTITKEDFITISDYTLDLEVDCWTSFVPELGNPLQFNATVTNGLAPYDYTFNFNGSLQTQNGTNLTFVSKYHTFTTTGDKILNVQITDAAGKTGYCTETVTFDQTGPEHIVDFSWEPGNPLLGQDITFTNNTAGGIIPYHSSLWTWYADPFTGNEPVYPLPVPYAEIVWFPNAATDPPSNSAKYNVLGDYPIELSVVDGAGWEQTKTKVIHFVAEDGCITFDGADPIWIYHLFPHVNQEEWFSALGTCCFNASCNILPQEYAFITNVRWKLFDAETGDYITGTEDYKENPCDCYGLSINGSPECWNWYDIYTNYSKNYTFIEDKEYIIQCEIWNKCKGELDEINGGTNQYLPSIVNPTLASQLSHYDVAYGYFRVIDCEKQLVLADVISGVNNPEVWAGHITLGFIGNHIIQSGAEITYIGHEEIVLDNNFSAYEGCEFTARIEPCPDYSDNLQIIDHHNDNKNITQVSNSVIEPIQVSIYPNPTLGEFSVVFSQTVQKFELKVLNSLGELIVAKKSNNCSRYSINIGDYPDGVYFVNVKIKDSVYIDKIIKQ